MRSRGGRRLAVAGVLVGFAVVVGVGVALFGGAPEPSGTAVDDGRATPTAQRPQEATVAFQGAGGLRLGGTLLLPGEDRPAPAVLVIPGFGPTTRDGIEAPEGVPDLLYRDVAAVLADAGVASLRYDKRGTGASVLGDEELAFDDLLTDAERGLDLLAERVDIDADALAVVGHDEGGLVALRLAASDPRVRGVVLLSTPGRPLAEVLADDLRASADDPAHGEAHARELHAVVDRLLADGSVPDSAALPGALRPVFPAGATGYLQNLFAFDPAATAAQIEAPVMIVRGARAPGVSGVDAERLRAALGGEVATHVGADANHTLALEDDRGPARSGGGRTAGPMHDPSVHNPQVTGITRDDELLTGIAAWVAGLFGLPGADRADTRAEPVTVTVTAQGMAFHPGTSELNAGRHEFVLVNDDTTEHDMELAVAGAHDRHLAGVQAVPPGERRSFVVDLEPGAYELACHRPGHFEAGMVAPVTVR